MQQPTVSRRNFLKALGAGALGAALFGSTRGLSFAQISPTTNEVAAFFRFKLGNMDMTLISDSAFGLPVNFFGPEEDVTPIFERYNLLNDGSVPATVLNLVAQMDGNTYIFDTGNGLGQGKLLNTLPAAGIDPADVTGLVMSHWHPDHTNGLSNDGTLNFPNAMVYFPQGDYDFMQAMPEATAGPSAKLQPALDAGQVMFYENNVEIVSGITGVHTPGHTPGHHAFMIESDGAMLVHFVDAVISAYVSLMHPEWAFGFDADPAQAVESRKMILQMASDNNAQVMGYHFPFPGLGYALANDDGTWEFLPAAF